MEVIKTHYPELAPNALPLDYPKWVSRYLLRMLPIENDITSWKDVDPENPKAALLR
jgi:hypothetical protein